MHSTGLHGAKFVPQGVERGEEGCLNEVGVIPHILTVLLPPTPPVALWQQQARVINLI